MALTSIKKRDGTVVKFQKEKIANAIFKAAKVVGGKDKRTSVELAGHVIAELEKAVESGQTPDVETVQDIVEKVLIEKGHAKTAKAYILYRQKRAELRKEKEAILEKQEIDEVDKAFDLNALKVLKARYLRKDEKGRLKETPKELFTRVSVHTALPDIIFDPVLFDKSAGQEEKPLQNFEPSDWDGRLSIGPYKLNKYHLDGLKRMYDRANKDKQIKIEWKEFLERLKKGDFSKHEATIHKFYSLMVTKKFMPNTPALANFGNPLGMGSACFVLGIEDSMESIMDTLKYTAIIHKAGGGTGFNFSDLRPEGDFVSSTSGVASGPMSFMRMFDTMTEVVKQGGIRRGANMGILNINHPDIEKFITAKEGNKGLRNFNISVLVMPDFWEHYEKNEPYPLVNPRTGEVSRKVNPRMLFDMIVYQAWESAEPGIIFYDHVNKYNPFLKSLGPVVTTNPCVAADSLIPTENGLERIDSAKGENIIVDNRAMELGNGLLAEGCQMVKPLQRLKTGYKECLRLETKSGYELTATPDHKILTADGWKELQEIKQGDEILIQSGEGRFNSGKKLPFEVVNEIKGKNGRKYNLNLPTEWSRELGLILGWVIGDGWISKKHNQIGLVFAREDEEAKKLLQTIFEKYCNRKIKTIKYDNGCVQIRSSSKYVVEFFSKLGVKPAGEQRELPNSLFTATEDAVIGFLEGLFSSDGTIALGSKSRNYARINSSSLKLLKQVQLLLLNFGMRSSIYDRFTSPKSFRYVTAKGEIIKYKTSGKNYELNISKQSLLRLIHKISFIQQKNKNKADRLINFEFYKDRFTDTVKNVEYAGEKEVWDITEPQTHSFIANGIIVHNCGEVLLYPDEPCNLGSINTLQFVKDDDEGNAYFDWAEMASAVQDCTHFLDNVIDVNKYPLAQIEKMSLNTRKVGLGVMGVADTLYELGLKYNGEDGREFMERLMEFVNYHSKSRSIQAAKERGPMPYFEKSFYTEGKMPFSGIDNKQSWRFNWEEIKENASKHGVRNGFTTVIAPTGSISMIAGCSSGIEPVYSLVFEKIVTVGNFYFADQVFENIMKKEGLYSEELMKEVVENGGSVQQLESMPEKLKEIFVTAMDISPEDHIRALAAFQKWTDSSISKTNNFPADATVEDIRQSYILAHKLGCKDVTVFRDSSIKNQALVAPKRKEQPKMVLTVQEEPGNTKADLKECPECQSKNIEKKEGCVTCADCGWGACT